MKGVDPASDENASEAASTAGPPGSNEVEGAEEEGGRETNKPGASGGKQEPVVAEAGLERAE